jgi:hypothetical protein
MKRLLLMAATAVIFIIHAGEAPTDSPRYTADGQLLFPSDYREWVYLSSGLGMTYGPVTQQIPPREPAFDNVFVTRSAYRHFLDNGAWPDKTMFVLEVRSAAGKGSINNGGHYQTGVLAIEVEVKDAGRFPGKWAFFGFGKSTTPAKAIPASAACYTCHPAHGAVDNTFVQFYPTLLEIARKKGTLTPAYLESERQSP